MDNRYTLTRAGELSDELISIRRKIHQNPEIGFDLPETTALVAEKLKAYGIEFKKVGKAGISAVLGNAEAGGKTFLLRADMDALPFEELTGLTFASNNGCMHACGHDIHTSALLGAARILKEREGELRGRVKLMFQPCEEDVGGAADMVEAGVLENPSVDGAMALHVVHHSMGSVGYQPIFSINYGAEHWGRMKETLKYALGTVAFFGIFWTTLVVLVPNGFVRIFMKPTEAVLQIAPSIMRCYGISFLLLPLNIFSTYYFQSLMKPAASFVVSVGRGLVISGALIMLLPTVAKADFIWFSMPVTEIVIAVFVIYMMVRYTKRLAK